MPIEKLMTFMAMQNIADALEDSQLREIGLRVVDEYEEDYQSLDEWRERNEDATKIAAQIVENKTHPWPGAANIVFPLISQAALNFNSRAYPEVVQGDKVVKARVIGADPEDKKAERAERISDHMSYQLTEEMPNWEADTDKLLLMLPIVGTMFKEVYWNEVDKRPSDDLLMPDEIVVNKNAKSLDLTECRRISKCFSLSMNAIYERESLGLWTQISYSKQSGEGDEEEYIEEDEQEFIQQCRYEDLDGDGYKEPYIVVVHKESMNVVRILRLFDIDGITFNVENTEIIKIRPYSMYVDYHFIPSFDGCFYSTGFGHYLYPINKAINTTTNQLIDAGTLSNQQSGFMAKGLRSRMGSQRLMPGEWKPVDTRGADLQGSILPLPVKEPSMVLFNLLQFLISTGKEMSSITDIMSGIPQGQNTPVGTTFAMIEQGMKTVDAVYKRIYRSLKKEFGILYRLNNIYLPNDLYVGVLDVEADAKSDYSMDNFDVFPVGDSRISNQVMRTMKAQAVLDIARMTPGADVRAAATRVLDSMDVQGIEEIFPPAPSVDELGQQMMVMQQQNQMLIEQVKQLQGQINSRWEARQDEELRIRAAQAGVKIDETRAKTALNMATVAEKVTGIEGQNIDNVKSEAEAMSVINKVSQDINKELGQ